MTRFSRIAAAGIVACIATAILATLILDQDYSLSLQSSQAETDSPESVSVNLDPSDNRLIERSTLSIVGVLPSGETVLGGRLMVTSPDDFLEFSSRRGTAITVDRNEVLGSTCILNTSLESGLIYQGRIEFDLDSLDGLKLHIPLSPTNAIVRGTVKREDTLMAGIRVSMITSRLGLKQGMKVVESGTGTGSLSVSLIKCVYPSGHLFTYEFNQ